MRGVAAAARRATVLVDPAASSAPRRPALARKLAARTRSRPDHGVGANRSQACPAPTRAPTVCRLLRSDAGGGGPLIEDTLGRAMLVVRANQIAAGGCVDPGVLARLAECVNRGLWPPAPVYRAIGAGNLTALRSLTSACSATVLLPDAT